MCTPAHGAKAAANRPVTFAYGAAPAGFEQLVEPQDVVVDLVFGDKDIGQARITATSDTVTFGDVAAVVALLPQVRDRSAVANALSGPLDAHVSSLCAAAHGTSCGQLAPGETGVIYDPDSFRLHMFVNPAWLEVEAVDEQRYLAPPTSAPSVVDSFTAAISGTIGDSPLYNLQNHAVFGSGNKRLRSHVSLSSAYGVLIDDVAGEIDTRNLRYSAGLLWAPGIDFIGERKILGIGVGTQLDTRADRELLQGSPLILFLSQQSRVDILRGGRLLASQSYDAGNHALDTSGLPDGSYPVTLRVQEAGGAIREERRFFVKNRRIAAAGSPAYFAYAGMLTVANHQGLPSFSGTPFFEAGMARRLDDHLAFDATMFGVRDKVMAQAGVTIFTNTTQFRLAALASISGDMGALFQVNSTTGDRLGYYLDLRQVWSSDGGPLLPGSERETFEEANGPRAIRAGAGKYSQASASIFWRLPHGEVGLLGSYRHDDRGPTSYTVGPTANWALVQAGDLSVELQANVTRSNTVTAAFVGIRVQLIRAAMSLLAGGGVAATRNRSGEGRSRSTPVGYLGASWQGDIAGETDVSAATGLGRTVDGSFAMGNARLIGSYGSLTGDLVHRIGTRSSTQYSLAMQTGVAVTGGGIALGGREVTESGIVVHLTGEEKATFEVLVDDVPKGRIQTGGRLPIFLVPYREYSVRIRPVGAHRSSFDSAERRVTLYPGNMESLSWKTASVLTVFGQAVRRDGTVVANAEISSSRGLGRSDEEGYFQLETGAGETATFRPDDGSVCRVDFPHMESNNDYVPIGTVVCL